MDRAKFIPYLPGLAMAAAFLYALSVDPSFVPMIMLFVVGVAAIAFGVAKRDDPLNPLYGVTLYFLFGIGFRGLCVQLGITPNIYMAPIHRQELIVFGYLVALLAVAMLLLGHASARAGEIGRRIGGYRFFSLLSDCFTLKAFLTLCALIGIFQILYFKHKFGIPLNLYDHSPSHIQKMTHGGGMARISLLVNFPLAAFFLSIALLRRLRWRILLGSVNFLCVMAWALLIGSKSLIAQMLIGVFVIRMTGKAHISRYKLVFMSVALIFIVSLGFAYRVHGVAGMSNFIEQRSTWEVIIQPLLGRTAHFDMCLISIDKIGFGLDKLRLGENWLQLFYWFVPREWWPDKPMMFGYTFGMEFIDPSVYYMSSYAPSLLAEFYVNFHVIGVALGFMAFGWIIRFCSSMLADNPTDFKKVMLAIIYGRLIHSVEGPVVSHVLFTLFSLTPILIYSALHFFERSLSGRISMERFGGGFR